jgi:predicted secreted Zn-dependent protease
VNALRYLLGRIAGAFRQHERLFSYGTLQLEDVQRATFGRRLVGRADTLAGYRLGSVDIASEDVVAISGIATHPIVHATGNPVDLVAGTVFEVTPDELARADAYEESAYQRVRVTLVSGTRAWVYAAALAAGAAQAVPIVDATIAEYTVTGATETELRASLDRAPLAPDGRRRVGFTHPAEVTWHFEARARKGRCLVVSVTVTLTAVTTLPHWDAPPEASAALRQRWTVFSEALALHEQGHVEIAREAAARIEQALWSTPAPRTCDGYEAELNALANRMFDAAVHQQDAYDATTDYGRTQGVSFP